MVDSGHEILLAKRNGQSSAMPRSTSVFQPCPASADYGLYDPVCTELGRAQQSSVAIPPWEGARVIAAGRDQPTLADAYGRSGTATEVVDITLKVDGGEPLV
ncbi:hypothetical protein MSAS_27280 [Mycobacterium saskatchewanense]|uniref:Uncharacterized protein n=1 Tax=Mycobacterium saskatchewanense TaxID=220927 RepID=A0AAJ3NQW5_9MYCO|nr:hypothetical protein AWC23_12835 [Mycobacterium saskatchewanense]BBX63554.1 hypothetical protein MSAS_27280 [Mycobacterium saskatchewanense]